jgi:hypothetical protein
VVVGAADHRQATLLALHFRIGATAAPGHRRTLLAAALIARVCDRPAAQWDAWFLAIPGAKPSCGTSADHGAPSRTCIRRARLAAAAGLATDSMPASRVLVVLEERLAPTSAANPRRYAAELAIDPADASPALAPVDPRAILSVRPMSARSASEPAAAPDVTIDLEGLGIIAPRPESW